ncbi:hypothetical protein SASPL_111750 [Salvia splendens]|uniref:Uncharacterized protein n=1 Tax=Salvia splendens TaxID=180675 RepID=A0A8X8Y9I4_SALSN|nr:hypothetical protein SASPL_111750 [Salvia splendens]
MGVNHFAYFLCHAFPEDAAFEARAALFSFLDYASRALLMVTENQYQHSINSAVSVRNAHTKRGLDLYIKLIVLHQKAIGKCICLRGKQAKLASQAGWSSEFPIFLAVERALVGVWGGSMTNYEIVSGNLDGGEATL